MDKSTRLRKNITNPITNNIQDTLVSGRRTYKDRKIRKKDEEDSETSSENEDYTHSDYEEEEYYKNLDYIPECNPSLQKPSNNTSISNNRSRQNCSYTSDSKTESSNLTTYFMIIFILALAGSVGYLFFNAKITAAQTKLTRRQIEKLFPSQPSDTLETIEVVIDDVLKVEPIHPAVFLFLYDNQTKNDDFISTIAKFACGKLNVSQDPIILDENIYKKREVINEFGYLIEYYRPLLEDRKIMVIKDLNKMSGETAKALHTFCDDVTPLVDRAVYILTLKVDKYYGNEVHTAEIVLNRIWSDLKKDILAPLLTRVVNTVIKIY